MEQIILDFYNKAVNSILDMRINVKPEDGWNKDFLTYGQIATYVDTLGLSEGTRTEVYIALKDFFFNHLDEFQNIMLGLPDNFWMKKKTNKKQWNIYINYMEINNFKCNLGKGQINEIKRYKTTWIL